MKITASALANASGSGAKPKTNPFEFPKYPPGVLPNGATTPAMDAAPSQQINAMFGFGAGHGLFAEGIGFMGYPYLAELTQRPEYRRASEVIAEEMTRKWIRVTATGEDKTDKIAAIEAALKKHRVRQAFRQAATLDGFFGRAQIFINLDDNASNEELLVPLLIDPAKIAKGSLRGFKVIDPTWTAPNNYNSNDPMSPRYYKPQSWFIMAREVHATRLLTFISRPVPDILKPAYNFGGLSLSQMLKPYVDNWLSTRQAVNDLINSFTTWVLSTNMESLLQGAEGDSGASVLARIDWFNLTRNNRGAMAIDKESEEFNNVSTPLGTLDHLQAQAQEHMATPAGIPLVKFFGITPSGLNTSTDGEIRTFYDSINARQESEFGDHIETVLRVIQLDLFGEIDPGISYEFVPLWQLDEAGQAAVRKINADTDAVYSQEGVIGPEDIRARVAAEPGSPYFGLTGPAPGIPEMPEGEGGGSDPAEHIGGAAASGSESGANSGV